MKGQYSSKVKMLEVMMKKLMIDMKYKLIGKQLRVDWVLTLRVCSSATRWDQVSHRPS